MRVVLVAHQYWPTSGAATQVLGALVAGLRQSGASVDVLTTGRSTDGYSSTIGPSGERIFFVSGPEGSGTSVRRVFDLFKFAIRAYIKGRRLAADVVISDPPPTAAFAAHRLSKRLNAGFVFYLNDSWGAVTRDAESRFARAAHPMVKRLEDYLLRRSMLVIGVTSRMAAIARGSGAPRTLEVSNGVDLEAFTPHGRTWSPNSGDAPFLLYAGNAGVVHGAHVFIEGAKKLWDKGEDFDLVFMGYGADRGMFLSLAGEWADRVHLLPSQSAAIVAEAFRGAAGALSSLRPLESYSDARPIKSMTGLACGCPAVYVGAGDFSDLLRANDLGFVSEWSAAGAARSIGLLLADLKSDPVAMGELRVRCAQFARANLDERVGVRKIVRELERLFQLNGAGEGLGRGPA